MGNGQEDGETTCSLCHLDLSKNSRISDAKSRLNLANLG